MKQCITFLTAMMLIPGGLYGATITGQLQQWHTVTLTFEGPQTSEHDAYNPFLNYRLDVTFSHQGRRYVVPGFYAADGNAAETSAKAGDRWRVHFTPNETGEWSYQVSFRKGKAVAVSDNAERGTSCSFDGSSGTLFISASDKTGRDFRSRGRLQFVGQRYLRFTGSGEYFLKAGAGSPENFLAYHQFDGTYYGGNTIGRQGEASPNLGLHKYAPHLDDWKAGDPTWQGGKGKSIIGALNYLASKGMNSVYFLTMNVLGDGEDVWPWIDRNERYRFDCSKLDQWDIVFSHMEELGIMLHVILQETENELLLDVGRTDTQRRLYYRELVARFGHHLALTWNLGEENGLADWAPNGQDDSMQKAMADHLRSIDPYGSPIVIHTLPTKPMRDRVFLPLLGHKTLDGPSLQVSNPMNVHDVTLDWIRRSQETGRNWIVCLDETGPASTGVKPDIDDPDHENVRKYSLWGHLMAGGGGVEWYFGYKYAHSDLHCEDWRSRDRMWDLSRYALDFFQTYLPFPDMEAHDELVSNADAYCLAKEGDIYAVYLREGGSTDLDLKNFAQRFSVQWYDPRSGGKLHSGTVRSVVGPGKVALGNPKQEEDEDWVVLIQRMEDRR